MKNKNNPDEELKKLSGKYYYSEKDNEVYEIEGEKQSPVGDKKELFAKFKEQHKNTGSILQTIFQKLGIADEKVDDEDSALPFI